MREIIIYEQALEEGHTPASLYIIWKTQLDAAYSQIALLYPRRNLYKDNRPFVKKSITTARSLKRLIALL